MKKRRDTETKYNSSDVKRQKGSLRWTFILAPLYIVLTYFLIFHGHKMDRLQSVVFMLCLGIPIGVALMWTGFNAETKWKEFLLFLKAVILAFPFCYLVMDGPSMYREYQLEKYKTLTFGIVTNTSSKYNSRGGTTSYWAAVKYYYHGQVISGQCGMNPDQYKTGDSVFINYSSDIPEFYELAGKKN